MNMSRSAFIVILLVAGSVHAATAQAVQCPSERRVVYIRGGPNADTAMLIQEIRDNLRMDNTTVLLAPNIDLDFSNVIDKDNSHNPLIRMAHCVTLASYVPGDELESIPRTAYPPGNLLIPPSGNTGHGPVGVITGPTPVAIEVPVPLTPPTGTRSARTPHTLGPVLHYGSNPGRPSDVPFIEINCKDSPVNGDGARISGLRLFAPTFDDHHTNESGIEVKSCHDVDISNIEIAGWGGAAIYVDDAIHGDQIPTREPDEIHVAIHDNYIHHNQHSTSNNTSLGYGVNVGTGGFVAIFQNVFDFNKHAITASGLAGGYRALRNLVLKGGGYRGAWYARNIHIFDVHGTANCPELPEVPGGFWGGLAGGIAIGGAVGGLIGAVPGALVGALVGGILGGIYGHFAGGTHHAWNCGDAGFSFTFQENTFQYKKDTDIKIRGTVKGPTIIDNNVFVRSDQDAAIDVTTHRFLIFPTDNENVKIGPRNRYNVETFGQYHVCDFDGDGVDDLFLPTGVTWWFSSAGRFPWTFLKADATPPEGLTVGYFDGDNRCDVLAETTDAAWVVSSGGVTDWVPLGGANRRLHFGHPLSEVRFGRFDPDKATPGPGIRRQTTHAFWRRADGQWFITPLSVPSWRAVASSSFPLSKLRFGDFNGDWVTDVLANEGGHWAVSESAQGGWRTLNAVLNDPVEKDNVLIVNLDADDNIDDMLKCDREIVSGGQQGVPILWAKVGFRWLRSRNGTQHPWEALKEYAFVYPVGHPDYVPPLCGFAGQFGTSPGASALVIDADRFGHFFDPAEAAPAAEWKSLFHY